MATPVDTAQHPRQGLTGQRSLGQLVSDASADVSSIVRGEIELAKTEVMADVTKAGKGAGFLVAAGVLALYMLGLIFLGLAGVIAIWLDWWSGLLIMAGVLLLVVGILALVGISQIKKVKGKPESAISQGQKTVAELKASAQAPHRAGGAKTVEEIVRDAPK